MNDNGYEGYPEITRLNPDLPEENRPHCSECGRGAVWFSTTLRHSDGWEPLSIPVTTVTVTLPCGHDVRLDAATALCMQRPVELMDTDDDSRDRWWFGPESVHVPPQ